MNTRLLAAVILASIVMMTIGVVRATPTLSVQLTDSHGNNITDTTVPINTLATISAYYIDSGGANAQATLTVFLDSGSGPQLVATLYSGTVASNTTVTESYSLNGLGTYQFRWTCTPDPTTSSSNCPPAYQQRCQVSTTPQNTVPEPIPAAGLALGLLAFGVFAVKRKREKPA